MRICGQQFNSETIQRIQSTVEQDPLISRGKLSRQVCEWLDWRSPNSKLCEVGCRKALLEIDRRGLIQLPKISKANYFQQGTSREPMEVEGVAELNCSLSESGNIEIIPVPNRYSKLSSLWNDLMDKYHYLGKGPLCGAQIRYLVKSEFGWVGGLSFSSASFRLKDRDKWIGWSEAARHENLQYVICNSRFLIIPTVRVPNLASHVLSQSINRLCDDWLERYNYKPVLLETFIDPQRFAGTCYKAANWLCVGETSGRRASQRNEQNGVGKKIYMYSLESNWQSRLCREAIIELGSKPQPKNPVDWVEEEFGTVDFYDNRLQERLYIITRDFFSQPGALIPQACNGSIARAKASYRFFSNKQVNMDMLLKPHIESTAERIKEHRVVLAAQDTTSLNYTAHFNTEGLGPINTAKDKSVGLILHDTLAFTVEGTPLGLLDAQCWARDPDDKGKRYRRRDLPIEEKESIKWLNSYRAVLAVQKLCPDTTLVSVGDREADIYELFYEATKDKESPELLVRAERTRNRKVDDEYLWDKMFSEPASGYQEVYIPGKGSRKARTAKLEIRFSQVTLKPPKGGCHSQKGKKLPPIDLWAVYAREIEYPPDLKDPLEWMLLTTIKVSTFEDATEKLEWYTRRWGIEVYHRTLKSGCRIEDRRLNNADRIESCLAIDMVIAWRIFLLTMMG